MVKYFSKFIWDNNLFFRVVTKPLYNIYRIYFERKILKKHKYLNI